MLLLPSPPGSPREPGPTCPPASSACPPQPSGSRGHGDGDGGGIITRARSAECKKKLKDKSNHACKASGDKFITAEEVQCKWNQHGSYLNIQLVSSGAVRLKDLSVILSNRGCSVAFPGGFVWRCTFYGEIEASCSKVQCRERDRQLILNLQKKREHEDWPTLSSKNDAGGPKSSADLAFDASSARQSCLEDPGNLLVEQAAALWKEAGHVEKNQKPWRTADSLAAKWPSTTERDELPADEQPIAGKVLTGQTTIQDRNKMCLVRNYQPLPVHIKGSLKADISKEHVDEVGKPGGCVSVWSINKNWYKKSAEVMVVNVYLKQVQRDRFRVTFSPYHLTVVFQTRDERFLKQHENATPESRFQWTLELLHVIDPEQSSYTLRTSYLEISLRKKDGQRWKPTDEPFCKTPEESLPPRSPTEARKAAPAVGAAAGPVRGSATHHVLADLPEHCTSQSSESATACTAKPMCKVPPIMASSGGEGEEAEQVCVPGFTGLVNLGNTCFMNSVIQALSNTRELRDYLHDSAFKADINYSNVLGTGGRLAVSFAIILRTLWKGTHYAFSPSKLKEIVSNKASQFSGFSQHDAQEFLAFLLDGLHEDLNLAANTPTPQQYPEPHGSLSDQHMAERAWARHKAWNDSFIVHLFHGLYKSKLVCPVCGHVSITFDPFLYLPVPLPQRQRVLPVYFLPREPYRRPVKLSVRVRQVNAHGTDVIKFVAERMKVHPDNLKLVQRRKIPDKPVTHCANCQKTSPLHLRLRRCMNCYRVGYCNLNCQRNHWVEHKSQCQPEAIGLPFLVSIPESRLTFHRLAQIMEAYARYSVNVFQPPVQPGTAFLQDPEYSSPSPTSSEVSLPPPSPASCSRQSNAEQPRLETQLPSEIDKEGQGLQASRPQATTRGEQRESGWENAEWAEELDSPLFKPILRQSDYPQADELKTLRGEDGVELKRDIGGGCHVLGHRRMQERVAAAASLVEARVESSSPHARVEEKDGSGTKKPLRPEVVLCATAAVHGLQQQDKSWQGWTPQFSIKVIENNVEKTLNHRGDSLLDIPDGAQLAMDWNNDSKQQGHVMVLPRELDCDEELPTEEHASSRDIKDSVSMPTSLHHCLKLFTKPETLTPEEAWLCPQCEQPREALKQLMLWRLPPVLVVQLKRFSFCSSVWREKISNLVTFPIRGLDLSEFCVEAASGGAGGDAGGAAVYDLYAAINHYGGLIGGHYTAYARLPCARNSQCSDMGWRWFDDSTVTMVNESQVMSRHAYLLFYRRRDCPLAPYRRRPAEAPWTPAPARQDPAEEIIILDEEEEEEKNDDWPVTLNSQNTRASTAPCSTETFSSRSTTKNSAD
uniref:ubiquitinyl hydrolase 1 n=1 Tax=Petromyzon marinus TaxID=7757 RepID=A0AAJ7XBK2_PETMA|nr:ubiquitin carboxyl-terminal hydrolase 19-like isoform X4 [Petromyzon marinus]